MRIVAAVAILTLGLASSTGAQPAADPSGARMELWAGVAVSPGPSGDFVSVYSPPLLFDGDFTSHGGQTLTFSGATAVGFEGGANVFLVPHAGIQILADRIAAGVSGANGPYGVSLHYISRLPPDDQLVPVDVGQSTAWPDTDGSLTQWTFAVNGVVRVGQPRRVSLTLSGGLSYYRLNGSLQPVGYTTYRLGGHSVLFEDDYRLAASLEAASAIGFNGGGEINVAIRSGVAFMAGYRFYDGPTVEVPVRVTTILNADQLIAQQPIADIAQRLAPAPARVELSRSRVVVGLKLMR